MARKRVTDLAVFGGAPAFVEKLHVGRPNIGVRARLYERLDDILDRRWLTNHGIYEQEFEERLSNLLGVKHCIAVCNATIGLEIAIRALGLSGEVIVPSFTFVATAHALQWLGLTPVFCDIDPHTHNLDPRRVEAHITPRTSGILGVHVWGRACAVGALDEIARRHRLKLLFDAAHAFACSCEDQMIGNFGDAEVFSFHATKFFNTFEGGAITTNDDELAERARLMKNFGFAGYDDVIQVGTNGKMSEIAAAMGLTGLESLDDFIAVNEANYRQYRNELGGIAGLNLVDLDGVGRSNYQYVVLELDEAVTHLSRDRLLQVLWAENVLARRYFYPGCHQMEPYRTLFPRAGERLIQTERLVQRVLVLPTGTGVSAEDISRICEVIRLAVDHAEEIGRRLELVPEPAVSLK